MRNKRLVFVFLVLTTALSFAQGKTKEFGFISDNDLYTSSKNDMYYTNGLELFFRYLSKNENEKINKKITEFRVGQFIYNPRSRIVNVLSNAKFSNLFIDFFVFVFG